MDDIYIPPRRRRKRRPIWPYYLIAALLLALILTAVGFFAVHKINDYQVELTLSGDEKITVEYGDSYTEPGASAVGFGSLLKRKPQKLEVTIEGKVDAAKLGEYTISYSAAFEDASARKTRTVTVVDTKAPEILLVSDPEHYTLPGQDYQEEGFTATDNYDGDLTAKVQREEREGKVIYTVADSSGNKTTVVREILYKDPEAPKLTLKGESTIMLTKGDAWKEPGYTATDNVDGEISSLVKITGTVDTTKPGTYELTYEVTDRAGNQTKVQRKVIVKAPAEPPKEENPGNNDIPNSNQGEGKVIYLTFDDGPGVHTPRLLDVLAKYDVKATFFVCQTYRLEYLDDIANAGHSLALHSKTHEYDKIYASEEAFFEDLYAIQELVYQHTGIKSYLMRFPGGSSNSISKNICPGIMTRLTQAVQEKGFAYFDWNVDSKDAGGAKDAATVARNVIKGISGSKRTNHVVLQHDIHGYSVDAVEQIIQWGLANGYTFKALDTNSPACHHNVNN